MERIHQIVTVTVIVGILIGFISPVLTIIAGLSLWIILWLAQGGISAGNPYKRMAYSRAAPDFVEVKQFKRNEETEKRDNAKYQTTIFVFGIGGLLVLIGLIWIWVIGF
jgi:hypothetical protein